MLTLLTALLVQASPPAPSIARPASTGHLPVVLATDSVSAADFPLSHFGARVLALLDPRRAGPDGVRLVVADETESLVWILSVDGRSAERVPGAGFLDAYGLVDAGDVDRDGRAELLHGTRGAWTLRSGATLEPIVHYTSGEVCVVGDIDGDGEDELAFARDVRLANGELPRLAVSVRSRKRVDDLWTFDAVASFVAEPRHLLAAGDVDRDGAADLLVLAEDRALVLSGRDGRRLVELGDRGRLPAKRAARLGDVDDDGVPDFVLGYPDSSCSERRLAHVDVVSGRDGRRLHRLESDGGMFGSELAAGLDLDGDGCPDFAVATHSGTFEGVHVYSGRGAALRYPITSDWDCHRRFSVALLPDVDGDGAADLVVGATTWPGANCDHGSVSLWSGKTGAPLATWTARSPVIAAARSDASR
ncbi:MAG: VCBS repeat-containing protein [Planctomycetes bacterium]|nr:VCBS repeat-containing protein [Planctomycetota bacterium]